MVKRDLYDVSGLRFPLYRTLEQGARMPWLAPRCRFNSRNSPTPRAQSRLETQSVGWAQHSRTTPQHQALTTRCDRAILDLLAVWTSTNEAANLVQQNPCRTYHKAKAALFGNAPRTGNGDVFSHGRFSHLALTSVWHVDHSYFESLNPFISLPRVQRHLIDE